MTRANLTKIQGNGYTIEIVRMKGHCKWATKATIGNESRFRPIYYKADAERDLHYWNNPPFKSVSDFMRDFNHNFYSVNDFSEREVINDKG